MDTPQAEQIAQLEAMIESSPQAEKQGKLAALMHTSPSLVAQRKRTEGIRSSPLVIAQRKKLQSLFGTALSAEQPVQAKFFADEATEGKELSKAAFLDQLRSAIQGVADQELAAVQQTSDNCPYLAKWFTHYQNKDADYIQRAIARYAPDTESAKSVDEYIGLLAGRVRQGLKEHVATGSTEAVPQELVEEKHAPEDFAHIAAEQSEQTAQLACLATLCGGGGGGGGQAQGGGQQQNAQGGGQAQVVLPPPANAAIAPGGAHYATAKPNFGAVGGVFRGYDIFTINHVAAGDFGVSTFEVGTEVGFHDIESTATISGATDMITWHLCRFSGVVNFEVTTVVNMNLANHLMNHFNMVPGDPGAYIGNRVAVFALVTARLQQAGWVLP